MRIIIVMVNTDITRFMKNDSILGLSDEIGKNFIIITRNRIKVSNVDDTNWIRSGSYILIK